MSIKQSNSFNLPWLFVIFSSLLVGIILLFDTDKPSYYQILPLLPLTFGLVNMIFVMLYNKIFENLGLLLVIGLYYLRFVLVPLIMLIGDYTTLIKFNISDNINKALIIMIYELIVVYLVLYWANKKEVYSRKKSLIKNKKGNSVKRVRIFGFIIVSMVLLDLFVFLLIPDSRKLYSDILTTMNKTSADIVSIDSLVERGSLKRALLTLYSMTMEILRVFIPAYFIIKLRKKFGETLIGIIFSIPFILFQFLLVSNTHARSFLVAVVLMLLLAKLYPSWATKIYKGSIALGFILVVSYFMYKSTLPVVSYSGATTSLERASEMANAYFSGPDNIAAIFNVKPEERVNVLIYTLISSIPFNGTIFGISGLNYSSIYNIYNQSLFQIGPLIGESYFFFGAVFSPLLSAIVSSLAVRYGKKVNTEKNLWKYLSYIYFILILSSSLVLYSGTILLKTFGSLILPMLIISKFSSDIKIDSSSLDLNPKR